jgi:Zn-dependent membrane protease YugP/tetratricopeptide (TPR) repeat protein
VVGFDFSEFFGITTVALLLCLVSLIPVAMRRWMGRRFHRVCARVGDLPSTCGLSGRDVAVRLLHACNLDEIAVLSFGSINCYHPWKRQIRLCPAIFKSTSLSALATAAHEVGHAQHFSARIWRCRLRNILWPVCWALPVAAALLAVFCVLGDIPLSGAWLLPGTLIVCGLVVALQLPITLPLERDASQRARKLVQETGLLAEHEQTAFDRVLDAAWKTHAGAEVQRWVVLALLALVIGCTPFCLPSLITPAAGFQIDGAVGPQAVAKIEPPPPAPPALQQGPVDAEFEPADWTAALEFLPVNFLTVILAFVSMAFLLGLSKQNRRKHQPTREARAVLRNNAGSSLHANGQFDDAIAEYSRALELNPDLTVAWFNRGLCSLAAGRLEGAASDFNAAVRLAPHFLDAVAARGEIRLLLGQHVLGLADLEAVLKQNPIQSRALTGLADYWQRRGDFERAIGVWSDALEAAPEKSEYYRNRGLMYYLQGNQEQAIRDQTTALRLDPTDAIARNNRGAAYLKCGAWSEAQEDLKAAIALDPKLPNSFRHLAWLQATCPDSTYRDGLLAVSNATRALELGGWKQHEWFEVLAAAYAEAGNFEHALEWQQKCLDAGSSEKKLQSAERLERYRIGQAFRDAPASLSLAQDALAAHATT